MRNVEYACRIPQSAINHSPMNTDLVGLIKQLAAEVGYSACGIASAEPFEEYGRALDDRIGRFPETRPLYEEMRHRANPRARTPWARSIVACVRWYGKYELPQQAVGHIGRSYLADRRCEGCPDHCMPGRMKQGLVGMGLRVKTGGVPDRWAAVRAGIARFGKNCFAYTEHGSWINIETWLVDADLPPDRPLPDSPCPAGCDKCIKACPTGALVEPGVMRMDRCVAYLSYGAPEPVDSDLWKKMGKWIYGCDACQEACPLNKGRWECREKAGWMDRLGALLTPEALAVMDERTYVDTIHPRFWYIPADNIQRWHANARRAIQAKG